MDPRKMDRRMFTILSIVFVQMLGAAMILPILPLFAQREFALSPQAITLLVTSFFAAQFLAGPFLGRLSDTRGRIPVLILSQVGTTISFVMLAAAQSAETLFLARLLDGITGANIIVAQAYVTDITPREKRTEALGLIFAAFGIGFVIGPALGGVLTAAFGPRVPYLVAAGAAALVVLMTWFTLEETLTPEQRAANLRPRESGISPVEIMANRPLVLILTIALVGQFGFGLLQATFALYSQAVLFQGYSEEALNLGIGLLLATFGLTQFTIQAFLLRRALRRFGEPWLVLFGNTARLLASFFYAIITSPWLAALGSVLFASGMGVLMPSLQSLTTHTVDEEVRGGVLGIYQSVIGLSTIISTAVAGVIFAVNPTLPYWIGGVLGLFALLPSVVLLVQFGGRQTVAESVSSTAD